MALLQHPAVNDEYLTGAQGILEDLNGLQPREILMLLSCQPPPSIHDIMTYTLTIRSMIDLDTLLDLVQKGTRLVDLQKDLMNSNKH